VIKNIVIATTCSTPADDSAAPRRACGFRSPSGRLALAVLIDRGGRELPIQPDIVGKTISIEPSQRVDVLAKSSTAETRGPSRSARRARDPSLGKDLSDSSR